MNTIDYKSNCCSPQPSVVQVQSIEGIKGLTNAFVYVMNINSTFFVSSCHEITIISAGNVYIDNYDPIGNPLNLRAQVCYDFANNVAHVFNNAGEYRTWSLVVQAPPEPEPEQPEPLTAGEYDALFLSAGTYGDYHLTAYQYDTNAKNLLI